MRGEAVSQKVRIDVRFQSGSFRVFFHNLPDAYSRHFGAAGGKKDFVAGAAIYQSRALARKVSCQRFACFASDWDQARLASLADYSQNSLFGIKIFQARI